MDTSSNGGMKPSVSKATQAYLKQLANDEKAGKPAEEYMHEPDTLDRLIKENNLRMVGLHFYPDLDLMLVILNNKRVIQRKLSDFPRLTTATTPQLEAYQISRYGVHWPEVDEDLSLKGFLQEELHQLAKPPQAAS